MDYKPKKFADDFESRYNEYKSEQDKKSSMKEYLETIRPHLLYTIDGIKQSGEWEIHPTMKSKNMLSTDSNGKCTTYCKSDSSIAMIGKYIDAVILELFDSLLHKYQIDLEQFMKVGNIIFDYISRIYCICNQLWWIIQRFSSMDQK